MTSAHHIHVPTPGELVAAESGSALVTISGALGRAQIAAGGRASVIARAGMQHRPAPLGLISADLPDKVWLTPAEKAADRILGSAVARWPMTDRLWGPVFDAVPGDHTGPVFLHNAPAAAAGLQRRRPASTPVVFLHNEVVRGWSLGARRRLARSAAVVCDSRFIAERFLPGSVAHGEVLPLVNGVDVEQFHPSDDDREPTVLFVGKVAPHKGPDLLVEAARALWDQGLRFRLRIVGAAVLSATEQLTDFEQRLRARAAPLGDAAEFLPFVDRTAIADVYRSATIMVVPSNWDEPCSLTLPEGMASGLACVASNRGGLPEVGGHAVLYFDPANVGELAAHLRSLLTDEDERRERGIAARRRAEQQTWSHQLATMRTWLDERER